MTSRERVRIALAHEEPDRVPIDLGGTVVTSIAVSTYRDLRSHLGMPSGTVRVLETVQQIAGVDNDVRERFGIDTIPVFANPPDGYVPVFETGPDGSVAFKDEFGATLRMPNGCLYFDWQEFPLAEPSIEALATMPWPNPADPGRYRGLRERVVRLRDRTDAALVSMAPCGHDLLNQLFRVRGMENGMVDTIANLEFVEAFFDRLTETICSAQHLFLSEVGDLIDVHFAADDLAGQSGPLIDPRFYRRAVKPRQARIMEAIRSRTKAPVLYHSCGAVAEFIPDLIEIGMDILNPVQVSAAGMDTGELKRRFGKCLSFWGGGCDTQWVLPRGTPQDVRAEVKRRVTDLASGGGFVFNPVHNIQPFVPPANVEALFDAAREFGVYRHRRP